MSLLTVIEFALCPYQSCALTKCFTCSIDASKDDGSLGRLVNYDPENPNCIMKKVVHKGKPHLCLFAVKKISPGEEITYNYGDSSYSWRSAVGWLVFCS